MCLTLPGAGFAAGMCDITVDDSTELKNAITGADNKTICLKSGPYSPGGSASDTFNVTANNLIIKCKTFGCVLDGGNVNNHVVTIDGKTTTLKDITIQNGNANGDGGDCHKTDNGLPDSLQPN